jgi:hypothetical protein
MKKQKELTHMLSVVNELNAQLTAQLADKDAEVERLRDRLEAVYEAGCWGISHVGTANYASRESDANRRIQDAYYNLSTTQQEES